MYRILCYGDSNTWGYNPVDGLRLDEKIRWTGVLRQSLGSGFEVIENGENGRRVAGTGPLFVDAIRENVPLDVIIIFLGINDICFDRNTKPETLVGGIREMLRQITQEFSEVAVMKPEVILLAAVPINAAQIESRYYETEAEKVVSYGEELRSLAGSEGCGFIDSGRIISSSEYDGIHIEAGEHLKLGVFIADYIKTFLTNSPLNGRS